MLQMSDPICCAVSTPKRLRQLVSKIEAKFGTFDLSSVTIRGRVGEMYE